MSSSPERKKPKFEPIPDLKPNSLYELLSGLPHITFAKSNYSVKRMATKHTSDHLPIGEGNEFKNMSLMVVEDLLTTHVHDPQTIAGRCSLFYCDVCDLNCYQFYSEADLKRAVLNLLDDMIRLAGRQKELRLTDETMMTKVKKPGETRSKASRSDVYILKTRSTGLPIMVIEIKMPMDDLLLDDEHVVGQITDYMLQLCSFYGQEHVFGITTALKHWKFHWFPNSDKVAASNDWKYLESEDVNVGEMKTQRQVSSTAILTLDNPQLVQLLLTCMLRCFYSPRHNVKLIDHARIYMYQISDTWSWQLLEEFGGKAIVNGWNPTIVMEDRQQKPIGYLVLKFLKTEAFLNVFVALEILSPTSCGNIVVIKQFDNESKDAAEVEYVFWHETNNCPSVYIAIINSFPSLVMPLVFTPTFIFEETNFDKCKVKFVLDLEELFCSPGATLGEIPDALRRTVDQLKAYTGDELKAEVVVSKAVDNLCVCKGVHVDFEWRHVALLPVFNSDLELISMTPVLIDFEGCNFVESCDEAAKVMHPKLANLLESKNMIPE